MRKYIFTSYDNREMTIDEARQNAGEFMRDAHDLCCWPLQAGPIRKKANAIFAEAAAFEVAEKQAA